MVSQDEPSLARIRAAWHAAHVAPFEGLLPLAPGVAEGPLGGGNLCVTVSLLATPFAADLAGRIVLIEDVGEPSYKVDRLFTIGPEMRHLFDAVPLRIRGEHHKTPVALHAALRRYLRAGDVVTLKASTPVGLGKVARGLRNGKDRIG